MHAIQREMMRPRQCPHCGIELVCFFREVVRICEPPQVWKRYICENCRHLETIVYEDDYMNKTIKVHLKHDYAGSK